MKCHADRYMRKKTCNKNINIEGTQRRCEGNKSEFDKEGVKEKKST